MKLSNRSTILVITSLLMILIAGCSLKETPSNKETQIRTLNGESDHWNLQGYQLKIEGDKLSSGNGELQYKFDEDITDYISFTMMTLVDDSEVELQGMKIIGSTSFNNQNTGSGEQKVPKNKENKEITLLDLNENTYGVIEWNDSKGKRMRETIHLY